MQNGLSIFTSSETDCHQVSSSRVEETSAGRYNESLGRRDVDCSGGSNFEPKVLKIKYKLILKY
jgi:hypothetical protein